MRSVAHAASRQATELSPSPSACSPTATSCCAHEADTEPSKIQHLLRPALARVLCAVSYGCVTVYGAALSQVSEPRSDGFVFGSVLTSVGLELGVRVFALRPGGYAISRFVSGACRCARVVVPRSYVGSACVCAPNRHFG